MEAIIEDIAKEVSIFISVGTIIKDIQKHDDYEIRKTERTGLLLEHKPFLRGEKKDDLTVGYDELIHAFSKGRFFIAGFSSIIENGYKHDLEKLKRAVKDTVDKIKLEEESAELVKVSAQKSALELERAEILKEKAIIEREKLQVMDEKESLVQKRKSKLRSKETREEFMKQEEARLKAEREENERIESEKKMIRDHKIKILLKKKASQQQRFRLLKKKIN